MARAPFVGATILGGSNTLDGSLAITGTASSGGNLTITSGGLTVSAGGYTVTGNSTLTGTLGGLTGLTVASGGATITAGGATVGGSVTITPAAGVGLTVAGFSGSHSSKIADAATNSFNAGYLEIPQITKNANYTTVLSDSSKALYHTDGVAYTWTIDSNANVAYPIGTVIEFINDSSGAFSITIAITADVLVLSPAGTTGSRTLAQFGRATAQKVTATRWMIAGTGLT